MVFASDDCALYHQIKAPIGFLCRRGLNLKFFIQLSDFTNLTKGEFGSAFLKSA